MERIDEQPMLVDKQRMEAYIKLIEQLLNCPNGEESEILNANRDLLDAELLQVMVQVAEQFEADGEQDAAEFLRDLKSQLAEFLEISENPNSVYQLSQDYVEFLAEVLQATAESNGNSEVIYPILQANLNKLDNNFIAVLQNWAEAKLSQVESSVAEYIARVIAHFSELIQNFPLDNKMMNVEIAIVGYEICLKIFTYDSYPEIWAAIQNNFALAYSTRISGDRAENEEKAIAGYENALLVHTREAFPAKWAGIQNNLGISYWGRISGDRAENEEKAISAFQNALQVHTREAFPAKWAGIQNNLGISYWGRISGDRVENEEKAIAAYKKALSVWTPEKFPAKWAVTQNKLGITYGEKRAGDRAENLEMAIAAFRQALQVHTREDFPETWAGIQTNLGTAYSQRIKGDKAENLEKAIAAYEHALQVQTREAVPTEWAMTQNNLGAAYSERVRGDRAENLEMAIAAYEQALQVRTREAFPTEWAMTQSNLGEAYSERVRGDRAENQQKAIAYYEAALEVYTLETFPESRAEIQNNIGKLLVQQGRWYDGLACLEKSLAIYRQTEDTEHLQPRADTIYQIARTHHLMSNLDKARIHYRDALRIYEHIDNQRGIAACKTGLGRLMISLGFIDDARQELNQASDFYKTINDTKRVDEIQEVIEFVNHIKEKQLT